MSRRAVPALALVFLASLVSAEEAPETSVHIYPVGDLAAESMLRQGEEYAKISPEAWRSEHAETIESLTRLAELVQSLSSEKVAAVEPHRESLSLVVRHTAAGHREIEELLAGLRTASQPAIQLACRSLGVLDDQLKSLTAEQESRIEALLSQRVVNADEIQEFLKLISAPQATPGAQTVHLVEGKKTSWGVFGRPATAAARRSQTPSAIDLRVDYVVDDIGDSVPVSAQVFTIPAGCSAISLHYCDGGTSLWLITPSPLERTAATAATPSARR
jgi:hypothetical protein